MKFQKLSFTSILILMAAMLLISCGKATQTIEASINQGNDNQIGGVLRVLNWQGYGSDESFALDEFGKMYGVKVEHDYITSEEEMLTKLRTSPGVYDVLLPNLAYLPIAVQEGLLEPIDTSMLENWNDLLSRFKDLDDIRSNGQVYGVPWTWGATAMVYNTEVYPDGIDSMQVFWDPKYAGQIAWWDSYEDTMALVGIAMGDPDPYHPKDLNAVKQKMMELMPQVKTLWASEDEFDKLFANKDISLGVFWSGSASRAATVMGLPMKFVIPKEGAIAWIDTWAIAKDAPNREAAYRWIDYMISSGFYIRWDTEVGAPAPTTQSSIDALPADAFNRAVMGDPQVISRLVWMQTVSAEDRQQWNQIWEEVKAAQ